MSTLAIDGGPKTRRERMPPRRAFVDDAEIWIAEVFAYYRERDVDIPYQGEFERRYTRAFVERLCGGQGHADAVATGTIAIYAAVQAMDLPRGGEVLVSPITDPGTLSAIILNGLTPRLVDTAPGSYNVDLAAVAARATEKTVGFVLVHAAGQGVPEIEAIAAFCADRGITLIEDCSQSHAATVGGRPVGTFGDIAAFSTMYRKNHSTGSCGGVVYSRDEETHRRVLAVCDRGKPAWRDDFQEKDPSTFLFPALNLHIDEISCAIGLGSLGNLSGVIEGRLGFVHALERSLAQSSEHCRVYPMTDADSPFFLPIFVDTNGLSVDKRAFAEAVRAEGIDLNPHYMYGVHEWPWVRPYLADDFDCPNATDCRERSFNILFNERFGGQEVSDVTQAIVKVERHYRRRAA